MIISYSKLFVGISLPALCTGLASLLLSISADAQTIRPTTQKELKVFDPTTGNSGNIGIRAAAGTLSYTLTMPAARPTANQVLSASAVTGGNVSLTWATPVSGTVTSVGISVPTGFSVSSSPVTSAGTLSLSYTSGYALPTTASQTNWDGAFYDRITAASVTGTTTKTITLTQQDGGTVTATFSDLNTDAVTSVFGRTGAVTSTAGDYTTAQITESGNLYYTVSRAREAISLATTGSSGAATYSSTTGVLTIPNYTLTGLGGVGGSGTVNYLSKFAAAGTLTNSLLFDNGTNIGIGTITPTARLEIRGTGTTSATTALEVDNSNGIPLLVVKNDGSVGIGTATPRGKLDVMDGDLLLTDKDVSQPATSYADANAFGRLNPLSGVNGGLDIWGFSDANATAMRLIGFMGSSDPTDATPAILFRGDKSTATESQALSATETVFQFSNFTSPLVTILGSGNVGIGTTRPQSKLHVDGVISTEAGKFACASCAGQWTTQISLLDEYGDRPHHIETLHYVNPNYPLGEDLWNALNFNINRGSQGSTDVMTLLGNGNVGIGTTSPTNKLSVASGGNSNTGGGTAVNVSAPFGNYGGSQTGIALNIEVPSLGTNTNSLNSIGLRIGDIYNYYGANSSSGDTYGIYVQGGFKNFFAGNVGIGTTAPGNTLTIGQNTASNNTDYSLSVLRHGTLAVPGTYTANTPAIAVIDISGDGPATAETQALLNVNAARIADTDTNAANAMLFNVQNDTGSAFTIKGNRNVGIGTTTIGSRLQVNGGAAIGYSASQAAPTNGLQVSGTILQGDAGRIVSAKNANLAHNSSITLTINESLSSGYIGTLYILNQSKNTAGRRTYAIYFVSDDDNGGSNASQELSGASITRIGDTGCTFSVNYVSGTKNLTITNQSGETTNMSAVFVGASTSF